MAYCGCIEDILKGCDNNIGGLKKIYVAPFASVETSEVDGVITGITMSAVGLGATCSFIEIEVNKNSSSYTEEAGIDLVNGSTFYTTTLSAMIPRREVAKRNAIALLAAGQQDLTVILQDGNGIYWMMGWQNGANLTAVGEGSGQAKADGSKYSLTFLAEEEEQMPEVNQSVITSIGF